MVSKIDIFSGFLGAGKTMLIKSLLANKVYDENTVIIENEFGEVGIDGTILKERNIEIKEINSGCICCQVTGDFIESVLEIIEKYNPKNIIIEPSGVAKLSEILNLLNKDEYKEKFSINRVITVIDAQRYDMYLNNFDEFYKDQIKKAKVLVFSRTELIGKEELKKVISSIRKINSTAKIVSKSLLDRDIKEINKIVGVDDKALYNKNEFIINKIAKHASFRKEHNHSAKDVFESYPIDLNNKISEEELESKFKIIEQNKEYGNVIRAKGIVEVINGGYYQFDYVPNEFQGRKIKWANKKVISIIGSNLNKKELIRLFS
ncbi:MULTISPECIES: GTP-binding protein [unclassified Clostridium]|uniref:CobW family GTP-binding protein n=1 Tax=unclassified Clostridium TaxID=2614128 RepID=UPI0013F0A769|nr:MULTISPECIES: GTP-binding protein [unclassified Clostridium]NFG63371.1 GTP-binding protein [Clostridium botulinum]NFQ11112.1 GTP-binding protein [Clostridium botulinum]